MGVSVMPAGQGATVAKVLITLLERYAFLTNSNERKDCSEIVVFGAVANIEYYGIQIKVNSGLNLA